MSAQLSVEQVNYLKGMVPGLAEDFVRYGETPIHLERDWQYSFVGSQEIYEVWNKTRQCGFSWAAALRSCIRAQLFPPSMYNAVFVSINREEAREKIRYVTAFLEGMQRKHRKKTVKSSTIEVEFAHGNRIQSFPSREVRGVPYVDLLLDEFAHVRDAKAIFEGSTGSTTRGMYGITVGSTPYGRGLFHDICAGAGKDGKFRLYRCHEVPWWLSHVLCLDPKRAAIYAPGMRTDERVARWGTRLLHPHFEMLPLEIFQQEFETRCFLPGTAVLTREGVKNIEDVVAGDYVVSHSGRFRRVTEVMANSYNGPVCRVESYGCNIPLYCTPEHPFRVARKTGVRSTSYEWVRADALKSNYKRRDGSSNIAATADRITFPKMAEGKFAALGVELAELIGWYVAEGSFTRNLLQFSLGSHEPEYVASVQRCLKAVVGRTGTVEHCNGAAIISIGDCQLGEFLSQYCGSGAHNKKLPLSLIRGNELLVYQTLVKGDGHDYADHDVYTTVSRTLAYQVQLLANTLSCPSSVSYHEAEDDLDLDCTKKYIQSGPRYNVYVSRKLGKKTSRSLISHKCSVSAAVKSSEILPLSYSGIVYNLEVDVDHSYTANGRVVHNCFDSGNSVLTEEIIRSCSDPNMVLKGGEEDGQAPLTPEIECSDQSLDVISMVEEYINILQSCNFHTMYMGMDVGREAHATEIFVLAEIAGQIGTVMQMTLRQAEFPLQRAIMTLLMEKLPIHKFVMDAQGIGVELGEWAEHTWSSRVVPLKFSMNSKEAMVSALVKAFEDKIIKLYPTRRLLIQLLSVRKAFSDVGRILYKASAVKEEGSSYKSHADLFWALAMAVYAWSEHTKNRIIITTQSPIIRAGSYGGMFHGKVAGFGRR